MKTALVCLIFMYVCMNCFHSQLVNTIKKLNQDPSVHGMIVQVSIPHLEPACILSSCLKNFCTVVLYVNYIALFIS